MERPSSVRQRILDDHEALRVLLAEVEELVRGTRAGDPDAAATLPERGRALRAKFLDHLALEDAHLVPALRAADAWGEERARRVEKEHAEQRERMQPRSTGIDDFPSLDPGERLRLLADALGSGTGARLLA